MKRLRDFATSYIASRPKLLAMLVSLAVFLSQTLAELEKKAASRRVREERLLRCQRRTSMLLRRCLSDNARLRAENAEQCARIAELEAERQEMQAQNAVLESDNKKLRENARLSANDRYGSSSERTDGFDADDDTAGADKTEDAEASGAPENEQDTPDSAMETPWDDHEMQSASSEKNPGKPRRRVRTGKKKNAGTGRISADSTIPEIHIYAGLPEGLRFCDRCGAPMVPMGTGVETRRLVVIPPRYYVLVIHQVTYRCEHCSKEHGLVTKRTPLPPGPIRRSYADASMLAHVLHEKFVKGVPLYRLEKELQTRGAPVSRATLANWVIGPTTEGSGILGALCDALKEELKKQKYHMADETRLQVLKGTGKKPTSQSWLFFVMSSANAEHQVVYFHFHTERAKRHIEEFYADAALEHYSVHCDGFAGYHDLPTVDAAGCLAHARRYLMRAVTALPTAKRRTSTALAMLKLVNELFRLEREFRSLSPEERLRARQEKSVPVLNELYAAIPEAPSGESPALGRAVTYLRNQEEYLRAYTKDGELEICNNRAERMAKMVAVVRKNFLFCDSVKGAEAAAVYFTIIQSAKMNGLDPERYVEWILRELPCVDRSDPQILDGYLPWNAPAWLRKDNPTITTFLQPPDALAASVSYELTEAPWINSETAQMP